MCVCVGGGGGGEMREVVKVEEARVRNSHLTTPTLEMKDTLIEPLHSILRCQTEAETEAVCGHAGTSFPEPVQTDSSDC